MADNETVVYNQRIPEKNICEIYAIRLSDREPLLLQKLDPCYDYGLLGNSAPDGRFLFYYYQSFPYILDLTAPGHSVLARNMSGARVIWSPDGKLVGFKQGQPPRIIDVTSGENEEITEPFAPAQLSSWLPEFYTFFADDFPVIRLQP